jgi:hypothetical protein
MKFPIRFNNSIDVRSRAHSTAIIRSHLYPGSDISCIQRRTYLYSERLGEGGRRSRVICDTDLAGRCEGAALEFARSISHGKQPSKPCITCMTRLQISECLETHHMSAKQNFCAFSILHADKEPSRDGSIFFN